MSRAVAFVLVLLTVTACTGADDDVGRPSGTIVVTATAGPTCPVETDPPSPECAPRAVAGAEMVVTDVSGAEVARAVTGEDGTVTIGVPAGTMTVTPQPVEGLLGTAPETTVEVAAGETVAVAAAYDTGIR
jgi:hypothetical protein